MPNQGRFSIDRIVLPRLAFGLFFVLLSACLDRADAVDLRPGDYLVLDSGRVLHVNPASGDRTIISGAANTWIGEGPHFFNAGAVAVDRHGEIFVSEGSLSAILSIDPTTGDRTVLSGQAVGSGPALGSPQQILVESRDKLLVLDYSNQAILRIDRLTGDRTIVSSNADGAYPQFGSPRFADFDSPTSLVVGNGLDEPLLQVDLVTGGRSLLYAPATGSPFELPAGVLARSAKEVFVADPIAHAIFSINPIDNSYTVLSSRTVGAGPIMLGPQGIAFDLAGDIVVPDFVLEAVFRIDSDTGERTLVSGLERGLGPMFLNAGDVAVVPVPEPGTWAIILSAMATCVVARAWSDARMQTRVWM